MLGSLRFVILTALPFQCPPPSGVVPCLDTDGDRVCDAMDPCAGDHRTGDADADRICDDRDACPGLDDRVEDADGDGVCGAADLCEGDDATGDEDRDGLCADRDPCLGDQAKGDDDGDGVCDDVDPCDDRLIPAGPTCVVPSPLPDNPCDGEPVWVEGRNTGFVVCPDGAYDRAFATSGWLWPETETPQNTPTWYGGRHQCLSDSECTRSAYGACSPTYSYLDAINVCFYGCDSDADCAPSEACLPPGAGWKGIYEGQRAVRAGSVQEGRGLCIAALCRDGSDCASGECGFHWNHTGCGSNGYYALACRTDTDGCRSKRGCPPPDGWGVWTCEEGAGRWSCVYGNTVCGRPLTGEDGSWRVAEPVESAAWAGGEVAEGAPAAWIAWWLRVAQLEHASIASFARHTLELMSLGAPADLLADVARAQLDEIEHARLAWQLASAERPLGPGPLAACAPRADRREILTGLIEEGCVGETIAAAEARLMADRAPNGPTRRALLRIAEDEARHAALAWRTLVWLARDDDDRQVAEAAMRRALARRAPGDLPGGRGGPLTAEEIERLASNVLVSVIEPAWAAVRASWSDARWAA